MLLEAMLCRLCLMLLLCFSSTRTLTAATSSTARSTLRTALRGGPAPAPAVATAAAASGAAANGGGATFSPTSPTLKTLLAPITQKSRFAKQVTTRNQSGVSKGIFSATNGQAIIYMWESNLATDCDGSVACKKDKTRQSQTSANCPGGKIPSAIDVPYWVKPLKSGKNWPGDNYDVAVFFYNNLNAAAVLMDRGPAGVVGEASVKVHNMLGNNGPPARDVGIDGAPYVVGVHFPHSGGMFKQRNLNPCNAADVAKLGAELMAQWGVSINGQVAATPTTAPTAPATEGAAVPAAPGGAGDSTSAPGAVPGGGRPAAVPGLPGFSIPPVLAPIVNGIQNILHVPQPRGS